MKAFFSKRSGATSSSSKHDTKDKETRDVAKVGKDSSHSHASSSTKLSSIDPVTPVSTTTTSTTSLADVEVPTPEPFKLKSNTPVNPMSLPNWTIPPFPHPLPERKIGLFVDQDGILIVPRTGHHPLRHPHPTSKPCQSRSQNVSPFALGSGAGLRVATLGNVSGKTMSSAATSTATLPSAINSLDSGVKIKWGKNSVVESVPSSVWQATVQELSATQQELECYGIVGIERLFNNAYLFVITSTKHVGDFFHSSRPVFCCTGVLAIPLSEAEAQEAIQAQILKQEPAKPSPDQQDKDDILPGQSDNESTDSESEVDDVETPAAIPREPFFSDYQNRAATFRAAKTRPWLVRASRAVSEGRHQLDKLAADHRNTDEPEQGDVPNVASEPLEQESETTMIVETPLPLQELSPDQRWHEAKQAELEEKVVRETAKHFARGEFWLSYDFDLSTPLQRKRDAFLSSNQTETNRSAEETGAAKHNQRPSHKDGTFLDTSSTSEPLPFEEPYAHLPLWRRMDRRFWHNEHLSKDFVQAGLHAFVLPLMQGYFQIVDLPVQLADPSPSTCRSTTAKDETAIDVENPVEQQQETILSCQMLVISRRSKERVGLRYQRRGINEAGQVANYVETEQILYIARSLKPNDQSNKTIKTDFMSFVQFRGSIPLYWSQNPFSLKPPPILERGSDENRKACRKHFETQVQRYGSVICINLAEQAGKEGYISKAYRESIQTLIQEGQDEQFQSGQSTSWKTNVHYVDFDFHKECGGMKFENVQTLIDLMNPTLEKMQFFWHSYQDSISITRNRQQGVFRISCLDCLDRTNVVQSAFARSSLYRQLNSVGIQLQRTLHN